MQTYYRFLLFSTAVVVTAVIANAGDTGDLEHDKAVLLVARSDRMGPVLMSIDGVPYFTSGRGDDRQIPRLPKGKDCSDSSRKRATRYAYSEIVLRTALQKMDRVTAGI